MVHGDFDDSGALEINDLDMLVSELAAGGSNLLLDLSGDGEVDHLLETWADQRRPQLGRNAQLLQELRSSGTPDLAMLAVANRQIKSRYLETLISYYNRKSGLQ